jgi:DNA primase
MAGRIPKQFIEDVLLRCDIVEIIDARVPLKKAGKDYKACCPFHDEKSPSFTVSPTKQFYHCFGCGAHGTAIGFLMEYEHMSFPEAVEELATRLGLKMPQESAGSAPRADPSGELLRILEEASRYFRAELRDSPRAIAYLKARGISGEIAATFGIGYAPEGWSNLTGKFGGNAAETDLLVQAGLAVRKEDGRSYDRFRDRVMFPIHDYRGRIIGFGGRIIDVGEPKYLNSPETSLFHKGRELYGLFRARDSIKTAGRSLVVEGYMDVTALAQHGVDNVVATLGTATTREHLERLFRYAPEVVFSFDGDRAGREAAVRALETALPLMQDGRQVSFLFLPEGEDPDSLVRREGGEAFAERIAHAKPLPDFFFESLGLQVDLKRMDGRTRYAELARPLVARLPEGMFRDMMIQRLADISQVPVARLGALVGKSNNRFEREPGLGAVRPPPRSVQQPKQPSIVWMAAAMLVQLPELGTKVTDLEFLQDLDRPGIGLFRQLIEAVRVIPRCNTAALVEHFRDTEHESHVARLAAWNHAVLGQDVTAEFIGVLNQMRRAAIKMKVEHLLQKQKIYGLSSLEMGELAHLTRIQAQKAETAH